MTQDILVLAPRKEWYRCPECDQKLLVYVVGARCSGIYVRCKRCKKIVNVEI